MLSSGLCVSMYSHSHILTHTNPHPHPHTHVLSHIHKLTHALTLAHTLTHSLKYIALLLHQVFHKSWSWFIAHRRNVKVTCKRVPFYISAMNIRVLGICWGEWVPAY